MTERSESCFWVIYQEYPESHWCRTTLEIVLEMTIDFIVLRYHHFTAFLFINMSIAKERFLAGALLAQDEVTQLN